MTIANLNRQVLEHLSFRQHPVDATPFRRIPSFREFAGACVAARIRKTDPGVELARVLWNSKRPLYIQVMYAKAACHLLRFQYRRGDTESGILSFLEGPHLIDQLMDLCDVLNVTGSEMAVAVGRSPAMWSLVCSGKRKMSSGLLHNLSSVLCLTLVLRNGRLILE